MKQQYLSNSGFVVFAIAAVLWFGHISLFPGVVASQWWWLFVLIYLFLMWTLGLCVMIGEVWLGQKFQKWPTWVSSSLHTRASSLWRVSVVVMWMMALLIGLMTAWSLWYVVMWVLTLFWWWWVTAVSAWLPVWETFFVQSFLWSMWWIAVLLLWVWWVAYAVLTSRRVQTYTSQIVLWSSILLVIAMVWMLRLPWATDQLFSLWTTWLGWSFDWTMLLQMSFWSDMLVQLMVPLWVWYGVLMTLGGMKHRESKIVGLVIRVLSIKMVYMFVACLCVWAMWWAWTYVFSESWSSVIRGGVWLLFVTASELFSSYIGEWWGLINVAWYMMLTGLGVSSLLVLMKSVISEIAPVMSHYTREWVSLIVMWGSALMTMILYVPTYGLSAFGLSETYVTGLSIPLLTIVLCIWCLSVSKRLRAFILHRSRSLLQVYLSSRSIAVSWLLLCIFICAILLLQLWSSQFFAVDISAYPRAVQQWVIWAWLLLVLGAIVMGRSKREFWLNREDRVRTHASVFTNSPSAPL